jgi:predicted AlkP superfamily pyrophosphatase or phosphodiesterase
MRIAARALVAVLVFLTLGAPVAAQHADTRPYVVLVSFDGFRADYLDRVRLPNFRRVAEAGVRARAMTPSFPSKTFPNHYTLVTGLYPGDHGIVANSFWDPARGAAFRISDRAASTDGSWYGGEPIWVTAERQGVRAASCFWPGSDAAIGGVRPSIWMPYDEALPNDARVDSVAAWLRRPAASRPHLVTMYVSIVDKAGHENGPGTPPTDSALVEADRILGRLRDSLAASPVGKRVDLVVVADHGMMDVARDRVIDLSRWISFDGVRTADPGPVLALWFGADSARRDSAYAALAQGLTASGAHARVYRRAETPARWHLRDNPRAGDLLVAAEPGWIVAPAPQASLHGGSHGWDPADAPEMGAIFLAAGPDIRARGTIAAFPNVDVYPLLAALLRVKPAARLDGDRSLARAILR